MYGGGSTWLWRRHAMRTHHRSGLPEVGDGSAAVDLGWTTGIEPWVYPTFGALNLGGKSSIRGLGVGISMVGSRALTSDPTVW